MWRQFWRGAPFAPSGRRAQPSGRKPCLGAPSNNIARPYPHCEPASSRAGLPGLKSPRGTLIVMDFTPLYPHSSSSSSTISPDGRYALTSIGDRLVLRLTESMEVVRSWRCHQSSELTTSKSGEKKASKPSVTPQLGKKPLHSTRAVSGSLGPKSRGAIPSFRASTVSAATEERRLSRLHCISFSRNSQHVVSLSRQPSTSVVYVHSVDSNECVAQIEVGAEGVAGGERAVRWGPGSDCLMVWSDWGVRETLVTECVSWAKC